MATDNTAQLLQSLALDRSAPPRPRRWPWAVFISVLILGAAGWWWQQQRPLRVSTALLTLQNPGSATERSVLEATGYVTARRQATVSAKITGRVETVLIEEGQRVKAGDILARLDATDADAELALLRAQSDAATALLADLEVQIRQATRDAARQTELAARKLTSSQNLEDAGTRLASLRARLSSQQRQLTVAARGVAKAEVALANTIIRAPFDGVITVKAAQPGEIVSPISAGGGFTRTGIGTLVDMSSLEIEVDVNEAYISRVRDGQPVTAMLNAYPDWTLPAHVITIIPTADRAKATVKVRIAIDTQDARIVPDMGVRVSFMEESAQAGSPPPASIVLAPVSALVVDGDRNLLWVVSDGRARARAVQLGQQIQDSREIVSGANAGDTVVLNPPADLPEGARVAPKTGE
ncbi:MAG: efflux RND transporter periplasmic adaptor subunit [Gammaproteobacteria bacterium]|nr:efflux RND transporter periplasmic adaptor subunit [Gammaproteobacteria bacterium]